MCAIGRVHARIKKHAFISECYRVFLPEWQKLFGFFEPPFSHDTLLLVWVKSDIPVDESPEAEPLVPLLYTKTQKGEKHQVDKTVEVCLLMDPNQYDTLVTAKIKVDAASMAGDEEPSADLIVCMQPLGSRSADAQQTGLSNSTPATEGKRFGKGLQIFPRRSARSAQVRATLLSQFLLFKYPVFFYSLEPWYHISARKMLGAGIPPGS